MNLMHKPELSRKSIDPQKAEYCGKNSEENSKVHGSTSPATFLRHRGRRGHRNAIGHCRCHRRCICSRCWSCSWCGRRCRQNVWRWHIGHRILRYWHSEVMQEFLSCPIWTSNFRNNIECYILMKFRVRRDSSENIQIDTFFSFCYFVSFYILIRISRSQCVFFFENSKIC